MAGVRWYILELRWSDIDGRVAMAALGHAIFSLSLGGIFMVVYGSYLSRGERLLGSAVWTVAGSGHRGRRSLVAPDQRPRHRNRRVTLTGSGAAISHPRHPSSAPRSGRFSEGRRLDRWSASA
jgi:hypothetical protein